jgi:NADH dehydrogenase
MVVVAGSTGVLGSEICRRLRERGQSVRALVRVSSAPERVSALRALGCEIVTCDLRDRGSLAPACAGADVVISTVTAITTAKEGDSFAATDAAGNSNLIDAAVAAGAKQFIFVSFDTNGMPDAPLVAAKREVEQHLERSGLGYTILHPPLFMEIWLGPRLFADPAAGTATFYGNREVRFRYVAVGDVAEVAVRCVNNPAARDAVIAFGGPDALTQREALTIFEDAFAKRFTVTELSEEALEARWAAAPDPFSRSFAALMLGVARGGAAGSELPAGFPMRMTTVREYSTSLARGSGARAANQATGAPP